MIGDRYEVKREFKIGRNKVLHIGDILTEKAAYNFEKECYEDGGEYNELVHDEYGYICDVGSEFAKENLDLQAEILGNSIIE